MLARKASNPALQKPRIPYQQTTNASVDEPRHQAVNTQGPVPKDLTMNGEHSVNGVTSPASATTSKANTYPLPYITPSVLQSLPVTLPTPSASALTVPHSELSAHASRLLSVLSGVKRTTNPDSLFTSSVAPIFRDIHALTSSIRTFYHSPSILKAWSDCTASRQATGFSIVPDTVHVNDLGGVGWVDVIFTFTCSATPGTKCEGFLSIVRETGDETGEGEWRIWMIRTILKDFVDGPSIDELQPVHAIETNGTSRTISAATRQDVSGNGFSGNDISRHVHDLEQQHPSNAPNSSDLHSIQPNTEVDVLIIGAGPAGLSLSSRFLALSQSPSHSHPISFLTLSRDAPSLGIGGSWRSRYDSAKLHTIREYSHLPYGRTFASEAFEGRQWMTQQDLGRGYAMWARKFGVDRHVRLGWEVVGGEWDRERTGWRVRVRRVPEPGSSDNGDKEGSGQDSNVDTAHASSEVDEITIQCKHIVLATGPGGHTPQIPFLPNRHFFAGTALHSASFKNASKWKNLRGVVVGTANTAHDIAEDMLACGLRNITMLQRRTTYVLPTEYFSSVAEKSYNEHVPTADADRAGNSMPWGVSRLMAMRGLHAMASKQPERFDALTRAGYGVERNGDIIWHITERMGGHYMDMGSCEKIARGEIAVQAGVPQAWTERGLLVDVGAGRMEEVEADVVVFATGFEKGGRRDVERLFGKTVAERCDEFWGLDEEGEVRGAWKRSGRKCSFIPSCVVLHWLDGADWCVRVQIPDSGTMAGL